MATRLDDSGLKSALSGHSGWHYVTEERRIERTFRFASFSHAFGFIARVALAAEKAGHHPDWSNSYDRVTISLTTHDAGGVTDKDIALARAIDALA